MKVAEAAAYARMSRRLLYDAVRRGRLRAARIGTGRSLVFRRDWVDEYLEAAAESSAAIHIVSGRVRAS
jgi:excisionase family DNA binding protein